MPRHRLLWLRDKAPLPLRRALDELFVYTQIKEPPRSIGGRLLQRLAFRKDIEFPPVGGGGGHVAIGLARQFVRDGHAVTCLTLGYQDLPAEQVIDGIRLLRVRGWRTRADIARPHELLSYLWAVRGPLRTLLRSQQFDIVHIHFIVPDGLLTLLVPELRRLPLVVTVHGSDVPGFNPDRFEFLHRIVAPLWRRVTRHVDRFVCPSKAMAALLQSSAPWTKLTIIANGIDPNTLRPDQPRELRVLAVSRLLERKGVQDLIRALPLTNGKLRAEIVGSGPFQKRLENLATPLGQRIHFHGWLDNGSKQLRDLYERSAIFVFPSHVENFPVVLLEAMAAGMAIVAADIPSSREVLGEAALLVPVGDVAALARVIDRLATDTELRQGMQSAARRRLEQNFGWPSISRRYVEVFTEAQASHGPAPVRP
jgi:glycosyltransferase involved in cell wall biosynthesis